MEVQGALEVERAEHDAHAAGPRTAVRNQAAVCREKLSQAGLIGMRTHWERHLFIRGGGMVGSRIVDSRVKIFSFIHFSSLSFHDQVVSLRMHV